MTLPPIILRFIRYTIGGFASFGTTLAINYVLVAWLQWPLSWSYICALNGQLVVGYAVSRLYVYEKGREQSHVTAVTGYLIINLALKITDYGVYMAMVEWFGVWFVLAQCINLVVFYLLKFWLYHIPFGGLHEDRTALDNPVPHTKSPTTPSPDEELQEPLSATEP